VGATSASVIIGVLHEAWARRSARSNSSEVHFD
jgi:hypothetical protein